MSLSYNSDLSAGMLLFFLPLIFVSASFQPVDGPNRINLPPSRHQRLVLNVFRCGLLYTTYSRTHPSRLRFGHRKAYRPAPRSTLLPPSALAGTRSRNLERTYKTSSASADISRVTRPSPPPNRQL